MCRQYRKYRSNRKKWQHVLNNLKLTKNRTNDIINIDNKIRDVSTFDPVKDNPDFTHSDSLGIDYDPLKQIEKMTKMRELNGHYYFAPELHAHVSEEIGDNLQSIKNMLFKIFSQLPIYLIGISIIATIALIIYGIIKCKRRRNNNNHHRNLSVRFDTLNERIGLIDQRLNSTQNNTQSTNRHSAQEQRVISQDDTIIQDIRIRMDRLNNN